MSPFGTNLNEDSWADIGHGELDWASIWIALNATAVQYCIVEHGNPADHWRFSERSMATIQALEAGAV